MATAILSQGSVSSLSGTGAAYVRVSTDEQNPTRQYESIAAFADRYGVAIASPSHYFIDEGWSRDKADKRPRFQQLLREVKGGRIQWIVVDRLDRFGTKDPHQLIAYLYQLRESGCKLFDAGGKEWTGEDVATIVTAVLEGEKSKQEQREKSYRILTGMVSKAAQGEWQGGTVKLGFDVACYDRSTDVELWRVIFDGRHKRLQVFPDGTSKRFDGKGNFPRSQPTEVLRLAPSNDPSKIEAIRAVFKRFATEQISFSALGKYLCSDLGFRNSMGGFLQPRHVRQMLADPSYRGSYSFNKWHAGRFHSYSKQDNSVRETTPGYRANDPQDWIISPQIFEPLIDEKTWGLVQKKLGRYGHKRSAPRSKTLFLSGLVVCGHCGAPMVGRSNGKEDRNEFYCGTYSRYQQQHKVADSPCMRNGVFQKVLAGYVDDWLRTTGKMVSTIAPAISAKKLTGPLRDQGQGHFRAYAEALDRIAEYLEANAPEGLAAAENAAKIVDKNGQYIGDDFNVLNAGLIREYRRAFSHEGVLAEIDRLDTQHTELTRGLAHANTDRARAKLNRELAKLETRLTDLEQQGERLAETAEQHLREWRQVCQQLTAAMKAIKGNSHAHKAEAYRTVIDRIECFFTPTGHTKFGAKGIRGTRLSKVVIHPITGGSHEIDPQKIQQNQDSSQQSSASPFDFPLSQLKTAVRPVFGSKRRIMPGSAPCGISEK